MKELTKFIVPSVLIVLGILLLGYAFSTEQNTLFVLGCIAVVLAGAISMANIVLAGNKALRLAITAVLAVGAIGLAYADYMSIKKPIEFQKEKDKRYEHVKQRLMDIRTAEIAYKIVYNKYTDSFDSLINFVRYDSLQLVKAEGEVPDTMSLEDAIEAGIARRDTTFISVQDSLFNARHMQDRAHPFVLDSIRYVPFTNGAEFELKTGTIERSSVQVPVFMAKDSKPFDKGHVLQVGSLSDPKTNGNWE